MRGLPRPQNLQLGNRWTVLGGLSLQFPCVSAMAVSRVPKE